MNRRCVLVELSSTTDSASDMNKDKSMDYIRRKTNFVIGQNFTPVFAMILRTFGSLFTNTDTLKQNLPIK